MVSLGALCHLCTSPSEWVLATLAAIKMSLVLRVKEAVSVAFHDGMFAWHGALLGGRRTSGGCLGSFP